MQNPAASPPNTAAAIELALASATILGTDIGSIGRTPGRPESRLLRFLASSSSPKASRASAGTAVHGSGGRLAKLPIATTQATAAAQIPTTMSDHALVGCMFSGHSWARTASV